jgi:hypothetical protein
MGGMIGVGGNHLKPLQSVVNVEESPVLGQVEGEAGIALVRGQDELERVVGLFHLEAMPVTPTLSIPRTQTCRAWAYCLFCHPFRKSKLLDPLVLLRSNAEF